MGEDEVVPAVIGDQPIGGGEIDADLPLLLADLALQRGDRDLAQRRRALEPAVHRFGAVHDTCSCLSGCARGERVELARVGVGADEGRVGVERHVEAPCIVHLRDQADVGDGRAVTVEKSPARGAAIASSAVKPSPIQCAVPVVLVPSWSLPELALEIFEHPQIVERVDVAGDGQRHRPHMRRLGRIGRQQQRLGNAGREIHDDRQALRQPVPVDLEHRHEPLRVERAILVGLLLARGEIDRRAARSRRP